VLIAIARRCDGAVQEVRAREHRRHQLLDARVEPARLLAAAPGAPGLPGGAGGGPINNWTDAVGNGAVLAIDPRTGEQRWRFALTDVTSSGVLTTATDVLFTGSREGHFHALNARNGALLWKASLGGQIANGPMTYAVDGKQYVAVAAGHGLYVFALSIN
jgi:outer membrane protein assembly factor BamB